MVTSDMAQPLLGRDVCDSAPPGVTPPCGDPIGILGSGDFARSLAVRLLSSGFKVVVGSRNPKRSAALFPSEAEVTSQEDSAHRSGHVIFLAVFRDHYSTLKRLEGDLAGKILVDVSNNAEVTSGGGRSNAEVLAAIFPQCTVVKGFNGISAWALQSGPKDGNKQVLICSDSPDAKNRVSSIARSMGFLPLDMGALRAARELEDLPLRLLPLWKGPARLAASLFLFFYVYNFVRVVVHPYVTERKNRFYKMPLELINLSLPCSALTLLSLVYTPGVLAAAYQLRHGTKYRRFPPWLDRWMTHRKQIGLIGFFFASLHALYSLCLPIRRSARYLLLNDAYKQVKQNVTSSWVEQEVWRMELYLSLGIVALAMLSLLAVSSLPSVGNALNWREFNFIQARLGLAALVVSALHTLTYGWSRAFDATRYKFYLPPTFVVTLVLPLLLLVARGALLLPCLHRKLTRIRRGWERKGGASELCHASTECASNV